MSAQVLALYARVLERAGPRPTLVEWDNELPDWPVLAHEMARARGTAVRALGQAMGA
jgi:uncharacterized protein (UPF0276 family)